MIEARHASNRHTQEALCYARQIPVWGEGEEEDEDEDKCLSKEAKALLLSQVGRQIMMDDGWRM